MPRIWGWLSLVPLAAATGCTALLGDFSDSKENPAVDAATDDVSVPSEGGSDVTVADASDAGETGASDARGFPDVNLPDVLTEAGCADVTATITPSGTASFCPGAGVTLTASVGAVYAWSNGATTRTISATTAGTYSVTTVDLRGCRATSPDVTVSAFPAPTVPTISATATSFCNGSSVTLTGSSAAAYEWSTGATTQTTAITSGGTYTVTTTDSNGCPSTSAPFTVTEITAPHSSASFAYTGSAQSWTPPQCVSAVTVDAAGAAGGAGDPAHTSGVGGLGGRVQATLTVTPGQLIMIYVGGAGQLCSVANSGGTNGYDSGGYALCSKTTSANYPYGPYPWSGTGGAATDIRVGGTSETNRVLVAGGGGGAGYNYGINPSGVDNDNGGPGGGLSGGPASPTDPTLTTSSGVGQGGTQTAGGPGALYSGLESVASGSGSAGYGGASFCYNSGTTITYGPCGGGGGGGWYGGGGGCWMGGGGGSSYVNPAMGTNVVHTQGYQAGNGYLKITW